MPVPKTPPKTAQERHGPGWTSLCRQKEKLPGPGQEEQRLQSHAGIFVSVPCAGFAGSSGISSWGCTAGNSGEEKELGGEGVSERGAGGFWLEEKSKYLNV